MSTVLEVGNVLVPVLLCVLIGYGPGADQGTFRQQDGR